MIEAGLKIKTTHQNQEQINQNFGSTNIRKLNQIKKSSLVKKELRFRKNRDKSYKYEKTNYLNKKKFSYKYRNSSITRKYNISTEKDKKSESLDIELDKKEIKTESLEKSKPTEKDKPMQNNLYPVEEEPKQSENLSFEDIIPESIENPIESKCRLFIDNKVDVQVSPKTAMSLAASLENDLSKRNKGAMMFQIRKQKSLEWIIDETNVKNVTELSDLPNQVLKKRVRFVN